MKLLLAVILKERARFAFGLFKGPGESMKAVVFAGEGAQSAHGKPLFTEKGVCVLSGAQLDPAFLASLGGAAALCAAGRQVGIAFDGRPLSHAVGRILSGAMAAKGSRVYAFGDGFLSQMYFFTSFCSLQMGVFVAYAHGCIRLYFCGPGGLPLPLETEAEIERRCQNADAGKVLPDACREVSDMAGMHAMYLRALIREAGGGLDRQIAGVQSASDRVQTLFEDALYRTGAKLGDEVLFRFGANGTAVCAYHRGCGQIRYDRLLAVCCCAELAAGRDLALPAEAPYMLTRLAERSGRRALRYGFSPPCGRETAARALAKDRLYLRDALFLSMRLLSVLQSAGKPLDRLVRELPPFAVRKRTIALPFPMEELFERLPEARLVGRAAELVSKAGAVRVIPGKNGGRVTVLAEAPTPKAAEKLCAGVEARLHRH